MTGRTAFRSPLLFKICIRWTEKWSGSDLYFDCNGLVLIHIKSALTWIIYSTNEIQSLTCLLWFPSYCDVGLLTHSNCECDAVSHQNSKYIHIYLQTLAISHQTTVLILKKIKIMIRNSNWTHDNDSCPPMPAFNIVYYLSYLWGCHKNLSNADQTAKDVVNILVV